MMKVRTYANFEAAMAAMRHFNETLDRQVVPAQAALAPGDYGLIWYSDSPPIWYEIVARIPERPNQRGARGYSTAEPDGDYGTIHVAQLLPIPREMFERGCAANWSAESVPPAIRAMFVPG